MDSLHQSQLYRIWKSMRYRCDNPRNIMYKNYGAKGITYYHDWKSFSCFKDWALNTGYKEGLTLQRMDENISFTPSNCYFSSKNVKGKNSKSRLYTIWHGMFLRCNYPSHHSYKDYGGRGIRICKEWQLFDDFKAWALQNGYSDELTIDRINLNGNYEPSNCRFVDKQAQANNRRSSAMITYKEKTQSIAQWARECGFSRELLWNRLNSYHMSVEEALTRPIGAHHRMSHMTKAITFNGITMSQRQWAERIGISPATLSRRLKVMSVEDALTKPPRK